MNLVSDFTIYPVTWSDEEETYTSCLGSMSLVGDLNEALLQPTNPESETTVATIERVGPSDTPRRNVATRA